MIEIKNINKQFKEICLFQDVSLVIDKKKTKIVGANGAGKSVLLKMIVGYSTPDEGEVYYDNKQLHVDTDFLQDAGVSINAPQFVKSWTGLQNLQYLANINKVCSESELNELIKKFGLSESINKKYKTYSLGMQQKLRLIQAVMDKPKYLILDEPFNALDKSTRDDVIMFLDDYVMSDNDRQLVYTSHYEADNDLADCILEISEQTIKEMK